MAAVDAPLLIYQAGGSPPILFSPAEGTTATQDGDMAGELLSRLAESLGDSWREEWLEQAISIPHEALPAVLDGQYSYRKGLMRPSRPALRPRWTTLPQCWPRRE